MILGNKPLIIRAYNQITRQHVMCLIKHHLFLIRQLPMDNTIISRKHPQVRSAASPSRRSFIRYFSVSAAALAVEGCGGGGAGDGGTAATTPVAPPVPPVPAPPVAPPAPAAPVWLSIPTIAFTQGTPSSFSVADYITAANAAALTLTLNAPPLPAGVTFNAVNRTFDYDGRGAVAATDGHVLTAIEA